MCSYKQDWFPVDLQLTDLATEEGGKPQSSFSCGSVIGFFYYSFSKILKDHITSENLTSPLQPAEINKVQN